MGNFRHTGVADAQNTNEYATVNQIQTAGLTLLGANAGTISTTKPISTTSTLTLTDSTNGTGPLIINGSANTTLGAGIKLIGNGATTPAKFIHVQDGNLYFTNDGYTLAMMTLTDAGHMTVAGDFTVNSDERLKEDWKPMARDFLKRMAGVLRGTFTRKSDGTRSAGVGAGSLQEAFPEVVRANENGVLSVAYGQAALVTVLELIPLVLRLLDEHGETP